MIDEAEATVVRTIFDMAMGKTGRSEGVKNIAVYLNERGIRRRGHRFSTGSVHKILGDTTYHGKHYFNRFDSRNRTPHPPSQWVTMDAPVIIDEATYNVVQGLLHSRSPRRMPPRLANGPTLLAGVARCGHCGSALVKNTGKGGRYAYYVCSKRQKEGTLDCKGIRMRMDALDNIVVGEIGKRILEPRHLAELLDGYVRSQASRGDQAREKIARLRQAHKDAEAAIARLLDLVEKGLMDAEDANMRDRLVGLKLQRDELARDLSDHQKRLALGDPVLTPQKIERFGRLLRDKLYDGPPELRQAYARLLLQEVAVTGQEIRISGSKAVLARCASTDVGDAASGVLLLFGNGAPYGNRTRLCNVKGCRPNR